MIDEKKLIEAILEHKDKIKSCDKRVNEVYELAHDHIIDIINIQPQADKWISVEDGLPECEWGCETKALMYQLKGTNTIQVGYYGEGGKYRDRYFRTYTDAFEGFDAKDVIAWQPLPQPYKKEGAE